MTVTPASRDFAAMLDEVANGETVPVTTDNGVPSGARYPEFGEHLEKTVL